MNLNAVKNFSHYKLISLPLIFVLKLLPVIIVKLGFFKKFVLFWVCVFNELALFSRKIRRLEGVLNELVGGATDITH